MVWSYRIKFSKRYFLDETSGKSCDPEPFKRYFNIVPFKRYFNIFFFSPTIFVAPGDVPSPSWRVFTIYVYTVYMHSWAPCPLSPLSPVIR